MRSQKKGKTGKPKNDKTPSRLSVDMLSAMYNSDQIVVLTKPQAYVTTGSALIKQHIFPVVTPFAVSGVTVLALRLAFCVLLLFALLAVHYFSYHARLPPQQHESRGCGGPCQPDDRPRVPRCAVAIRRWTSRTGSKPSRDHTANTQTKHGVPPARTRAAG
jgi:hypothetical protein